MSKCYYKEMIKGESMNISDAIDTYLKHYPGSNRDEFELKYPTKSDFLAVKTILDETMRISIDWDSMSLSEIGEAVAIKIRESHPELNEEAIAHLRNYYTYLVK